MKAAGTGVGMGDLHRKECVTRLGFYGFGSFLLSFFFLPNTLPMISAVFPCYAPCCSFGFFLLFFCLQVVFVYIPFAATKLWGK